MIETHHLDEGALRALLDGELAIPDRDAVLRHLEACERCTRAAEEQRTLSLAASRALASLDVPVDLDAARAALAHRTAGGTVPVTRATPAPGEPCVAPRGEAPWPPMARLRTSIFSRRLTRPLLARTAVVVLALGGAVASALPGSPVRAWLAAGWELAVRALGPGPAPAPVVAPASTAPEAGVRVAPSAGRLRILLTSPAGIQVLVRFTDGEVAGVYAGAGARFRTAPGLVDAAVSGPEVRVEIPRGVPAATVEVNGRVFLRKAGDRLQLLGPGADTSGAEIRFRAAP